jgi:anti-sigma factor RsiW
MRTMTEMLDCDAVMRQLWDYLDGELTAEREQAIRAHLACASDAIRSSISRRPSCAP